jgi:hypothetical protein
MRDFTILLQQLQAETALVMNFFAGFSRFEFALVNGGFPGNNPHHATADWHNFSIQMEQHFNYQRTQELQDAVTYLENTPPKIRAGAPNALSWIVNPDIAGKPRLERLTVHVRAIRNNLFHGGKYPETPVLPAERDVQLLTSGIVMIEELVIQSAAHFPDVARLFDQTLPPPPTPLSTSAGGRH